MHTLIYRFLNLAFTKAWKLGIHLPEKEKKNEL